MNIQRRSDKHGSRVDEQREHEAEAVVRGGGTGTPHAPRTPRAPIGITPADVERRGNLAKWLSDAHYPADRDALLAHARAKDAPEAVIEAVRALAVLKYHNVSEVAKALGLGVERHV